AMAAMGLGMALVVSPLSTAVMTAVEDKDTGAASGINNAVSRIGGLFAVAAMGSLAAWIYARAPGVAETVGSPGFGEPPPAGLGFEVEVVRVAASDAAFAGVALATALLCVLSAFTAWISVPGKPAEEA